ncbi:transposase [Spirosoma sp. KCTC 42546]|uniref:transposase n=1 Tax=Spirosoma sp. KCTC 42546 TaxID=2520506 RepID=UPI001AEFFF77|nr:transposase [Spirosoma sp. KCTC 42546]
MPQYKAKQKAPKKYPTELSNQQWKRLKSILPAPKKQTGGPGRNPLDLREVINGILYWMRSGCSWSLLPNDYPNHKSVYHYYNLWSQHGIWEQIHVQLVSKARKKAGRKKRPTAGSIDSQSEPPRQAVKNVAMMLVSLLKAGSDLFWWTQWASF